MITLKILESARRDLSEGRAFYEAQEPGLGGYFISSVRADIEQLRTSAGVHPRALKGFHRALCRTFPFAIYYLFDEKTVTVYAVIDCRRNPLWIRRHLSMPRRQEDI